MVKYTSDRQRKRPRRSKSEVQTDPIKKRNYKWVVLIAFGMASLGAFVGQVEDTKTAITLGIVGFVIGSIGGIAILWGKNLPLRKGTKHASRNYLGGNDMLDIDDILK
jgi:polyferredoxin